MTPHFDKQVYYDAVRDLLFNGSMSQTQVMGQNFILREWRRRYGFGGDYRWLAYMNATTMWETGRSFMPVMEYGSQDYLQSKPYYPYVGRGFVQLTWEENYAKAGAVVEEDLVQFPDMALQPDIAAIIMFDGMADAWFTGYKLADFFNSQVDDPVEARRIINGTDHAQDIAGFHGHFLTAIQRALA